MAVVMDTVIANALDSSANSTPQAPVASGAVQACSSSGPSATSLHQTENILEAAELTGLEVESKTLARPNAVIPDVTSRIYELFTRHQKIKGMIFAIHRKSFKICLLGSM